MKKFIYTALSFSPMLALAQDATGTVGRFGTLATAIGQFINRLLPIFFALAILYFFWGLLQYIRAAGDADKAKEGRSHMLWGIVALAVMVSVYGLISWLQSTVGLNPGGNVDIPLVPLR